MDLTENQLKHLPRAILYKMDHPDWSWEFATAYASERSKLTEEIQESFRESLKPMLDKYIGEPMFDAQGYLQAKISNDLAKYFEELRQQGLVEPDTFERHIKINIENHGDTINITLEPITKHGEELIKEWNNEY